MTADVERCLAYARSSSAIVTALNPVIGYEAASAVVHASIERGTDLRTVLLEMGLLSAEEIDEVLDVLAMTRGGVLSSSLDRAREK
jgi:aspartate ammonia-lyase